MTRQLSPLAAPGEERDTRIGPDPLAAVLPVIAALGAIASIAAINWVANERPAVANANRRRSMNALRDLERTASEAVDVLDRMGRNFRIFVGDRGAISAPIAFGVHGLKIPQRSYPLYQGLVSDGANLLTAASQHAFEVMCLIEDGATEPPETLFFALGEAQERLSRLLRERQSLKATLDEALAIAVAIHTSVSELKSHRVI
ncbi:MAG: hypothetical protein GC150_10805 [Rhizobiales bacterium]|nr:hypothetical protein [Hyphomicrobiales bacterium]